MKEEALKFVNDIIKPWEALNIELRQPYSVNPQISDFTSRANSLAVSVKHLPEYSQKIVAKALIPDSRSYEIISDLADTSKHGELRSSGRECALSVGSMFERNDKGKVRFLRNVINIQHNTFGQVDFMTCLMEAAIFIAQKLDIRSSWTPHILNNGGDFSNKIKVHASKTNQVLWTGMQLQFVKMSADGKYEPVDLNSTVEFTLTSEF